MKDIKTPEDLLRETEKWTPEDWAKFQDKLDKATEKAQVVLERQGKRILKWDKINSVLDILLLIAAIFLTVANVCVIVQKVQKTDEIYNMVTTMYEDRF